MKIKNIILIAYTALIILPLTGCQLAKQDLSKGKTEDRLIGVFITREYLDLFDGEGYLTDHITGFSGGELRVSGSPEKYNGRLYATLTTRDLSNPETGKKSSIQEYVFEGVEGISLYAPEMLTSADDRYVSSVSGDGMVDLRFDVYCGDEEDKITLDGTLYVLPVKNIRAHYFNPVYQSEDGKVYAMSGQGISIGGDQSADSAFSQKLEESVVFTQNGKRKKKTAVINTSIKTMLPPQKIVLLQMDKNSSILSRQVYEPGKLPESITPHQNTNYILLESYKKDLDGTEKITRTLFTQDDPSLDSFYPSEDDIILKQYTPINW